MQTTPTSQVPSLYRRQIGDILVTAILDGQLVADFSLFSGVTPVEAERAMTAAFRPGKPVLSVSCFLVHTGGKVVLIDTGGGGNPLFDAGKLPQGLNAAGVAPDAVDLVLMTHLHLDHCGGLATPSGQALFPNAELLIHEDEAAFWLEMSDPPEALVPTVEAARASLAPYRDRMRTFAKGDVAPGIVADPLPGHTPGHTGFHIGSGNDQLFMWTDTVHLPELQARFPHASIVFDVDPAQATAQRKRLFDQVATDRILVAGPHLGFPAFAHLERSGDAYAFVPEVWHSTLS